MGFMNRTSWSPQSWIPLPTSIAGSNLFTWVDIIINNLDDGAHPFHLHGHSFYVIASHRSERGWGSYDPFAATDSDPTPEFNLVNPLRKDTVMVPRRGFVVLRFKADNPGLWMLHCHILVHQGSGMAMGVQVGGQEAHVEELVSGAKELCAE